MSRLRAGFVRFASVTSALESALVATLGSARPPACHFGAGRLTLTFRGIGATAWPAAQQLAWALAAAACARSVLQADARAAVQARAQRAIVVVLEDAGNPRGCAVTARWECVVPAALATEPTAAV